MIEIPIFDPKEIKNIFTPKSTSNGEDNGQVTIIGGSKLFHGSPLFALTAASRIVDMVFLASPDASVGRIAEKIKSKLFSYIWVPWEDREAYVKKSDAILIGPGLMRFGSERTKGHGKDHNHDKEGLLTKSITHTLLTKFSNMKWVIDGGSLQVMDASFIPKNSILTPNRKEFEILFKLKPNFENASKMAKQFNCNIILKGPETIVSSPGKSILVKGGNAGMTKGGTGDCLAGLTVALLAKNDPFLAACAASFIVKASADELYKKVGTYYNSDDLASQIPQTLFKLLN